MPAPPEVLALLQRFADNRDDYQAGNYKEAHLRQEFIDPLFAALGWDMDNRSGKAEAYKDVIHEDAIKVGGGSKAPDYCFRIGGTRKFFVEAKKPSVNIKDDIDPAYQLRRYAWSAKLPLSILTDFEELAVYDCRIKPDKDDKASVARVLYIRFTELAERWDELAGIFSKEAIEKGSFDKYAESNKRKRGTAEVDVAFLADIEAWRLDLAKNLALRNPKLDQRELNFAVQRIIDRIIFLRIAEDRGIEDYGRLQALTNGEAVYRRLGEAFRRADDRYNSGLFHFDKEKGRQEAPDELTLDLDLDDKVLAGLIRGLYYPESPYEFSVITADILGQVYEQFLGKVIKLTAGHRAQVEEKPEVRKAGGVYYTPTYIVDYIVQQTVGKLLGPPDPIAATSGRALTPKQAAKLKILDPACGSGSFLIGAYQYLLDWHRDWYINDGPEKHTKELIVGPALRAGQTRRSPSHSAEGNSPNALPGASSPDGVGGLLTIPERKRILLNNIYGVDIDLQAVEVTKLSLCLKVLEGASRAALDQQLKIFDKNRALPDLGNNIKCGNSLIGPDFYNGQQLSFLDEDERYRINVFDWSGTDGFPEIMKSGGFDAVIGNPPYVRIQVLKESNPLEVEYYKTAYAAAGTGNYDIYVVFLERALELINAEGKVGFIVPNKFLNAQYGAAIRERIRGGGHLSELVHFGHHQVFVGATTYTSLSFMGKGGTPSFRFVKVDDLDQWVQTRCAAEREVSWKSVRGDAWNFAAGQSAGLVERLLGADVRLGDVADIFVGIQTSADDVFIMELVSETSRTLKLKSKILEETVSVEKELFHPLASGTDVKRFAPLSPRQYLLFPYAVQNEIVSLIPFDELETNFPRTAAYLRANKRRLEDREHGKMKGPKWYGYIYLKNMNRQAIEKLCVPRLVHPLISTYDKDGTHYLDNVDVGGVVWHDDHAWIGLPYLVAILNSRLMQWLFPFISAPFRGGWSSANRQFLSQVPIRLPIRGNKNDAKSIDKATSLVEQMLTLHAQVAATKPGHARTVLERQIAATDRQIDHLVYQLYGLTEDEIKLVEAPAK